MNKTQIERFFSLLSKYYTKPCRIILTGAAAGALYGRVRPTLDVDFAAQVSNWQGFSEAVRKTSERTGIAAQFAEDIDRWSIITLLDYSKHTYLHKRFGSVELRLMEPAYWAIGKFSRYLEPDIRDLAAVFKKTGTDWKKVARVCGTALRKSPQSSNQFLFKRQVEHFFKENGRGVWGRDFDAEEVRSLFHRAARHRN